MLAYAASRSLIARWRSSPHSFLVIGSAHILAVAAVMSITIDLPARLADLPFIGGSLETSSPPARGRAKVEVSTVGLSAFSQRLEAPTSDAGSTRPEGAAASPNKDVARAAALPESSSLLVGENSTPSLVTAGTALEPPYPQHKLLAGEEASLTVVITVDESGKVVAVDPLGLADPSFLEASRQHIVENWRYRPARTKGRATLDKVEARLHFRLEG